MKDLELLKQQYLLIQTKKTNHTYIEYIFCTVFNFRLSVSLKITIFANMKLCNC